MRRTIMALLLAALATSCQSASDTTAVTGVDPCDVHVAAGQDDQTRVQTALLGAKEGGTICLEQGTFHFQNELSLTSTKKVTLRGAGIDKSILDFAKQEAGANGIHVYDGADGITLEDFTVRDTKGDGIRTEDMKDVTYRRVKVTWSSPKASQGGYGIYPIHVTGVVIDSCEVSGASDTGVYVGQSSNILVENVNAHENVAGIEIENSTYAEVRDCHCSDNVSGILVFNLPGLPVQGGKCANVHGNVVENNNHDSFAEPGTTVSKVPKGMGVIVVASDDNEIHDNTIRGNDTTGVAIVSYLAIIFGTADDPRFDHYPQGNWIHDNKFSDNGNKPAPLVAAAVPIKPVPDIIWDGCEDAKVDNSMGGAETNCVSNNGSATYANANLCTTTMVDTDIQKVTCEHTPCTPSK